MAELLEQIKKMSREEQQALIEQIYALWEERPNEDEQFLADLRVRASNAARNPQSGLSWTETKARLLANQNEQEQRG